MLFNIFIIFQIIIFTLSLYNQEPTQTVQRATCQTRRQDTQKRFVRQKRAYICLNKKISLALHLVNITMLVHNKKK